MKKLIFRKINLDILIFFMTSLFVISLMVWTIQAVNYLDFVTEDGHGFKIYFFFTTLNFPKIVHRILPFVFFISLFFTLISYEKKNELNIIWINGISKINLVNKILFFSLALMIFQIFLGSIISPHSQNKARNSLKKSNIDFFSSLIKERKFLAISNGITIFIEKKNDDTYENVFLDESNKDNTKVIIAKKGMLNNDEKDKVINFNNGKLININNMNIKTFEFSEINFLLNNLSSNSITTPKIQELKITTIFNCLLKNKVVKNNFFTCDKKINSSLIQELLKRIYKPIYIPLISLFCCLLLINISSAKYQLFVFMLTFFLLILSEISLRYSAISSISLFSYLIIPIFIFGTTYIYLSNGLKK